MLKNLKIKNDTLRYCIALCCTFIFVSCGRSLRTHKYVKPVNTETKAIQYQQKKLYSIDGIHVTNKFPAARLNNFEKLNDSTFLATITPENTPINPSPWYAFKLWSNQTKDIYVKLHYPEKYKHRYNPKLSYDGENWNALDSTKIWLDEQKDALLKLHVTQDTLWVAAQEIQDTKRVEAWASALQGNSVSLDTIGKSVLGRPLFFMNITNGSSKKKPTVIIISRQHPPEVTGFLAMKSFVETIIDEGKNNGFLDKYRVLVYPLLNPDGVDLGHYRHNTGGIDMNRDWSVYNQPEIAQITKHMVKETNKQRNDVLLGLDFHSTYQDVYYTPHKIIERKIPEFKDAWLEKIRIALNLETINDSPGKNERPTSSAWFNRQFGATGITYEIGDDTPRDFIKTKGKVSAQAMMNYLLEL